MTTPMIAAKSMAGKEAVDSMSPACLLRHPNTMQKFVQAAGFVGSVSTIIRQGVTARDGVISAYGTKRTCRDVRLESAFGAKRTLTRHRGSIAARAGRCGQGCTARRSVRLDLLKKVTVCSSSAFGMKRTYMTVWLRLPRSRLTQSGHRRDRNCAAQQPPWCRLRSMVENRFAFLTVSHQFDILGP